MGARPSCSDRSGSRVGNGQMLGVGYVLHRTGCEDCRVDAAMGRARDGTKPVDAWVQAWLNRNNQQSEERISSMNQAAAAQRQANAQQFAHSMAVQQQNARPVHADHAGGP